MTKREDIDIIINKINTVQYIEHIKCTHKLVSVNRSIVVALSSRQKGFISDSIHQNTWMLVMV